MEKTTDLERAAFDAGRKYRNLQEKIRDKKSELVRAATSRICAEVDAEFKEEYDALLAAHSKARAAMLQEREDHAAEKSPHPIGTKMVCWKNKTQGWGMYLGWEKVREGVIEICTRETQHPKGMRYGIASPGDIIIRHLTKDGKPGKLYSTLNSWREKWLPVGKMPGKQESH